MRWIGILFVTFAAMSAPLLSSPNQAGSADVAVAETNAELLQRIESLEKSQQEVLRRLHNLERQRVRELKTLLKMYGQTDAVLEAREEMSTEPPGIKIEKPVEVEAPSAAGLQPTLEEPAVAREEEPQSPAAALVESAKKLIEEEDYKAAAGLLSEALELDPRYDMAYFQRGVALHLSGEYSKAIDDFEAMYRVTADQNAKYTSLYNQACGHSLLGNLDKSLELLKKSYEEGFQGLMMQMSTDPDLDPLRGDPRFREFLMRLRYPS